MAKIMKRRVVRSGINIAGHHYGSSQLLDGMIVSARLDPSQPGRALIFTYSQAEYFCVAICPELSGTSAPSPLDRPGGIVAAFEAAYPELYWHIAKGKICAGEPLYGAIITTIGTTEIGHGESDVSADEAFRIAVENAGLVLASSEGSADV